jgi:hypothetical protein
MVAQAIFHVANSNAYCFSDAVDGDVILAPSVGTLGQRTLIGAYPGAALALSVSSNVLTVNRVFMMSNATGCNAVYSVGSNIGINASAPTSTLTVGGTVQATTLVSSNATLVGGAQNATDGYCELPGATLMQWGTAVTPYTGVGNGTRNTTVTFPKAFGAAPYNVTATTGCYDANAVGNAISTSVGTYTATTFYLATWTPGNAVANIDLITPGSSNSRTVYWQAVGPR